MVKKIPRLNNDMAESYYMAGVVGLTPNQASVKVGVDPLLELYLQISLRSLHINEFQNSASSTLS